MGSLSGTEHSLLQREVTLRHSSSATAEGFYRHSTNGYRLELDAAPAWLWWNILSLDAPTVACVWAILFAKSAGLFLSITEIAALALSVWLIYTVDRLLDGWNGWHGGYLQLRHLFHRIYAIPVASVALVAAMAATYFAHERVDASTLGAGLELAGVVALYMACIHAGRAWIFRLLPKEIAVGIIFAAGTSLPLWSRHASFDARNLVSIVLFGAACSLNCVAIECWEHDADRGRRHGLIAWADCRVTQLACALATVSLLCCYFWRSHEVIGPAAAVFCSALLTIALNRRRERLSSNALRVLADVALLIPALCALLAPF